MGADDAGVGTGGSVRPPLGPILHNLQLPLPLSPGGTDSRISQESPGENTSILAVASVLPSSPVTMSCPQFPSLASLPMVCMWLAGVPQGFEIGKLVAWCDPVGR